VKNPNRRPGLHAAAVPLSGAGELFVLWRVRTSVIMRFRFLAKDCQEFFSEINLESCNVLVNTWVLVLAILDIEFFAKDSSRRFNSA